MTPYDPQIIPTSETKNLDYIRDIAAHCMTYKGADTKRSIAQLVSTLALFTALCTLIFFTLNISYLLALALMVPAAGLLTRIFIFQHDCGHQSFFKSKKANTWTGRLLGILTVTPYDAWRRSHNLHHASSGNLDQRGLGGIDTITVKEYEAYPKWKQRAYRFFRHPLFLLVFGTPLSILIIQRLPFDQDVFFYEANKKLTMATVWKSVIGTNLGIIAFYTAIATITGWSALLSVALPILIMTTWLGGWLFYIQHQFEDTLWERQDTWNMQEAALMGSSYYELPKILQWFTGNIGLHHIHHLCSQIPNYKLQECMNARPELENINKLTIRESLKCTGLKLWDEQQNKLVAIN